MAREYRKEAQFKTRWYHRNPRFWFEKDVARPAGVRDAPEVFRLDVAPGTRPNGKPPVRIFLGTEPAQFRPERVFIWSVMKVRDPARVYEIHLMKDIKGYDRTGWKTGFTNYRYAIPAMAGGKGRAIYNDVDQIYLADPGEMFDLDMGGAGVLGITERETSVMLIDCEKMVKVWSEEDAKHGGKHRQFRDALHDNKLWGRLPPEWNARDEEYRADQSKCFHFTTLQTQPWQPFPEQLRYAPHPDGEVWYRLERDADAAKFTVYTKQRPSRRYGEVQALARAMHEGGAPNISLVAGQTFDGHSLKKYEAEIATLIRETGAKTVLDFGAGKGLGYSAFPGEPADGRVKTHPSWPGVRVTCYDPGFAPFAAPYGGKYDGVICTDVLEHISDEDIAWVLDELFSSADRFVFASAACYPARKTLPNGENAHVTIQSPDWWRRQFELAAKRRPGVRWKLCAVEKSGFGKSRRFFEGKGEPAGTL